MNKWGERGGEGCGWVVVVGVVPPWGVAGVAGPGLLAANSLRQLALGSGGFYPVPPIPLLLITTLRQLAVSPWEVGGEGVAGMGGWLVGWDMRASRIR